MPNLLLDVIEHLASKGLVTGDGIDAFRDFMPDSPDNVVVVSEYSGSPGESALESYDRSIQIKVRDINYTNCRNKINQIFAVLDNPQERIKDLPNSRWGVFYAKQTPFKLEVDSSNRTVFVVNFGVTTYKD
jgi:hypothetical protein